MQTSAVRAEMELRLVVPGGPDLPVPTDLGYTAVDPWAVRVAFRTGSTDGSTDGSDGSDGSEGTAGSVEWLLARRLLADGLSAAVGDGDVRVWPSPERLDVVHLAMSSPSGSALFAVDRAALTAFLDRTYAVVPLGAEGEAVDLDSELQVLLGDRC